MYPAFSGPVWISSVGCDGEEDSLLTCENRGWDNVPGYCSGPQYLAYAYCFSSGKPSSFPLMLLSITWRFYFVIWIAFLHRSVYFNFITTHRKHVHILLVKRDTICSSASQASIMFTSYHGAGANFTELLLWKHSRYTMVKHPIHSLAPLPYMGMHPINKFPIIYWV